MKHICLVKSLTKNFTRLEWFFIESQNNSLKTNKRYQGDVSQFVQAVSHCDKVIGLTDEHEVLFKELVLPKVVKNKLMPAIPYALEECLAVDVQTMHFVLLKDYIRNNKRTVAYVRRSYMDLWYDLFLKIKPNAQLISPLHLLSNAVNDPYLYIGEYQFWLKKNQCIAESIENDYLPNILTDAAESIQPYTVQVVPVGTVNLEQSLTALHQNHLSFECQANISQIESAYNLSGVDLDSINLLQGDYSLYTKKKKYTDIRYAQIAVVCSTILIAIGFKVFTVFELQKKEAFIKTEALKAYQAIMPEAKSLESAHDFIQRQLAKQGTQQPELLLLLLSALDKGMQSINKVSLRSLEYTNHELKVSADIGLSDYVTLQRVLKEQQVTTQRLSATTSGELSHVVFMIK